MIGKTVLAAVIGSSCEKLVSLISHGRCYVNFVSKDFAIVFFPENLLKTVSYAT